jgi:hypothetical protein
MPYGTAAHRRTANRAADRCANTWYSRQAPRPPEWLRVEQVLQLAGCHRRLRRRRRHRPPNRHSHQPHHRRTATAVAAPTACEVPSNSVCASGGGSSCASC